MTHTGSSVLLTWQPSSTSGAHRHDDVASKPARPRKKYLAFRLNITSFKVEWPENVAEL